MDLYYPLDYSLDSAYIEMLKTAYRLSVDILDKVAFFVRDYCSVTSVAEDRVGFRTIWGSKSSPLELRPELAKKGNLFLFALFDLALDLCRDGYYGWLYDRRNALTHRFLVVHDMLLARQTNKDIPRVRLHEFLDESITAFRLARAALMYLILFVDTAEESERGSGLAMPVFGTRIDDGFRWTPPTMH